MPPTPRSSFHGAAAAAAICLLLCFLLAPPAIAAPTASNGSSSCVAAEREALLAFKAGITSDPSRRLRSWRGQDCCRWYGVRCSTTMTGHVETLDLHNDFFIDDLFVIEDQGDDLSGARWLRGHMSSSLVALSRHLKHLDLGGNLLGGSMPMPEFLSSLKSLTYLDLSNMNFSGQAPPQLGNLTKLVYLDIHNDLVLYAYEFAYTYSSDVSWLARLRSLEYLDMSCVDLSAAVDWVHSVNTLPNLRVLYLYNCQLNTSVPSLAHHNNLTVLEELDLTFNSFDSPAAPNWYWDVTSLKSLSIRGCGLLGPFPDELGNITMLEILDMGSNNIKGMLPSTLTNLCSLQMVDLGRNNIDGDIADLIKRLPNCSWNSLQELHLEGANITGTTLKWVLNLTTLSVLDISRNSLSGSVPVEIGTLQNLTELRIHHNSFTGVISEDHFAGLMNLETIDLSHTYLQVKVGSDWKPPFNLEAASFSYCHLGPQFPNWLRWQSSILILQISSVGLAGRIPDWFWTTFSNSTHLELSYNRISGVLPLNLEFMLVRQLLLQSNDLTGSVPRLPRNIVVLDVSVNSFNGQLLPDFGAPYLQVALLFSNNITGTIPKSICGWPQLQFLDLSDNLLTGGLPDCDREELKQRNSSGKNSSRVNYTSSYSLEIHTLLLHNNTLSGGFPLFLKQCQNLMFLDLTQNRFSGELPMWINEDLPRLVMLRLRSNYFFGHIPIETTMLFSLRILDLANNTFSGVIPQSIVNLKALTTTVVDSDSTGPFQQNYLTGYVTFASGPYNDSLSLVIKGQVLDYRENAIFLMSIDLSCNKLTGDIPEEIGSLIGLINLNLSSNLLSGNIPHKIGNLQSLESLDLSNNQLSGQIPLSMSNLTSLSYLNLSYNNLSGKIPSGHQLDTLKADDPASMYIGNPNLCGYPLLKICPGDQPVQEDPFKWHKDGMTQMDFHLGLIVGFLVGVWIVFVGFLCNKTWRFTYFSLFDQFYDKVQIFFVVTWQQWFKKTDTN